MPLDAHKLGHAHLCRCDTNAANLYQIDFDGAVFREFVPSWPLCGAF
ncbi:MAG TPA: hypothetical protein DGR97_09395 [Gammaproteobacteria bacterium]|nr:hypothetical protein [Gammaproteobacteria bacterium]